MCFASVSVHCREMTAVFSQASAITIMSIMNWPTVGIFMSVAVSLTLPSSAELSALVGLYPVVSTLVGVLHADAAAASS